MRPAKYRGATKKKGKSPIDFCQQKCPCDHRCSRRDIACKGLPRISNCRLCSTTASPHSCSDRSTVRCTCRQSCWSFLSFLCLGLLPKISSGLCRSSSNNSSAGIGRRGFDFLDFTNRSRNSATARANRRAVSPRGNLLSLKRNGAPGGSPGPKRFRPGRAGRPTRRWKVQ
jgi:hypothetical protein